MRFLFIANSRHRVRPYLDPAVRYRCYNPAEDLCRQGHLADVCSFHELRSSVIRNYEVFVFHRPVYSRRLKNVIQGLNNKGRLVIADYDDLIFNPRYALDAPIFLNGSASKKIVKRLYNRNLTAIKLFQNVTVSTLPLAEEVRDVCPFTNIQVVHNGISQRWLDAAHIYNKGETSTRKIGYFPGTRSHDRDFQTVIAQLAKYLTDRSAARLLLVGSLGIRPDGFDEPNLIRHGPVDYLDLPQLIMQCWVTIAPLTNSRFNQCKSGLKFFESAAFAVPVIATPIPDMQRFEGSGIVLAETPEAYLKALELFLDPEFYQTTSRSVQDYALKHCMSMEQTKRLLEFVEKGANRKQCEAACVS
jgi:glycosyltransferase involved in cell wall biosynthesis